MQADLLAALPFVTTHFAFSQYDPEQANADVLAPVRIGDPNDHAAAHHDRMARPGLWPDEPERSQPTDQLGPRNRSHP